MGLLCNDQNGSLKNGDLTQRSTVTVAHALFSLMAFIPCQTDELLIDKRLIEVVRITGDLCKKRKTKIEKNTDFGHPVLKI